MGKRILSNILVTGGAGFIGSNFIRILLGKNEFPGRIVNVDKLTYAGNLGNLRDVEGAYGGSRYFFQRCDICDRVSIEAIFREYDIDTVVHFAAESHVDRSICGPADFIQTNIVGTFSLLEAARCAWEDSEGKLFHHISTDEVYGSIENGCFCETNPYAPHSPYSASKASSDHLVKAYYHTYGLPVTISNCSNNYGPYQFPEKLIPLMILNMLDEKPLPVYGDGMNVRDWIFVDDHNEAVWKILTMGASGETYNIGGGNEIANIDLVRLMCDLVAKKIGKDAGCFEKLIAFIKDRPGHDRRYAMDIGKISRELGWRPSVEFVEGMKRTIEWYCGNGEWLRAVKSGEYREWVERQYGAEG